MDTTKLRKAFGEAKKELKLDFARTNVDNLGDCMSCVNAALADKYGMESHGIWAKHWTYGMNGHGRLADQAHLFIAHDLTDEQGPKVMEILGRYFKVTTEKYDHHQCIEIIEK